MRYTTPAVPRIAEANRSGTASGRGGPCDATSSEADVLYEELSPLRTRRLPRWALQVMKSIHTIPGQIRSSGAIERLSTPTTAHIKPKKAPGANQLPSSWRARLACRITKATTAAERGQVVSIEARLVPLHHKHSQAGRSAN